MADDKYFANRGLPRNKKPIRNIVYEIELSQLEKLKPEEKIKYEQYKFKEEGYLILYWWHEAKDPIKNWHGFVTPSELKERIGEKQWGKFCSGKRTFILQRRVDGKNIQKTRKTK